jgi:hypothetical protein
VKEIASIKEVPQSFFFLRQDYEVPEPNSLRTYSLQKQNRYNPKKTLPYRLNVAGTKEGSAM